jgi:hypothetical protein
MQQNMQQYTGCIVAWNLIAPLKMENKTGHRFIDGGLLILNRRRLLDEFSQILFGAG